MFDQEFISRFDAKLDKSGSCWIWTASVAGKGYGQMKLPRQRKQEYSHRIAYMLYKGQIPEGIQVCHTCDTPHCCNPDHLFLGTAKENLQDMRAKNRHLSGAKNSQAKLTEKEVAQIKECLRIGIPQSKIAVTFGVHQTIISKINCGHRWSHVK
jgi:hypothetical protein